MSYSVYDFAGNSLEFLNYAKNNNGVFEFFFPHSDSNFFVKKKFSEEKVLNFFKESIFASRLEPLHPFVISKKAVLNSNLSIRHNDEGAFITLDFLKLTSLKLSDLNALISFYEEYLNYLQKEGALFNIGLTVDGIFLAYGNNHHNIQTEEYFQNLFANNLSLQKYTKNLLQYLGKSLKNNIVQIAVGSK